MVIPTSKPTLKIRYQSLIEVENSGFSITTLFFWAQPDKNNTRKKFYTFHEIDCLFNRKEKLIDTMPPC